MTDNQERLNVWIGDDPDHLKRQRPKAVPANMMPRRMRRADLVCTAAGDKPMVLAVVYPRDAPANKLQVLEMQGATLGLGADFTVACRCGSQHKVDGVRLRAEVLATFAGSNVVPVIDVSRVA